MALFEPIESSIFKDKPQKEAVVPKSINTPTKKQARVKVPVPQPKPAGKSYGKGYLRTSMDKPPRFF